MDSEHDVPLALITLFEILEYKKQTKGITLNIFDGLQPKDPDWRERHEANQGSIKPTPS